MNNYKITGIIIASGMSGRMNYPKPLMHFEGVSFVSGIICKLSLVCNNISLVLGHKKSLVHKEINSFFYENNCPDNSVLHNFIETTRAKINFIYNDNYKSGMFSSLLKGLSAEESDWYLYHFVDQPGLPISFYTDFIKQLSADIEVIQPEFNSRLGHPILFNYKVRKKILSSDLNSTLRDVINKNSFARKVWTCNYKNVLFDVDTEDEYKKLLSESEKPFLNTLEEYLKEKRFE